MILACTIDKVTRLVFLCLQKNQKLTALCSELEEQVKDMEIIIEENEKQECEWNQARYVRAS